MFLLAWSFALNAVEYAKRRRIFRIVRRFVEEAALVDGQAGLICRYAPETIGQSADKSFFDFLNGAKVERCVYRSEAYQILIKCGRIYPQEGAWLQQQSYWNADVKYSRDKISFFVRLSLHTRRRRRSSTCVSETSSTGREKDQSNDTENNDEAESVLQAEDLTANDMMHNLDDVAHLIAQHRRSRHLLHYESTLEAFCEIVFKWTEGKLFQRGVLVDEIYTVDLPLTASSRVFACQPSGLENEVLSASATLSTSRLSLESSSGSNEAPYSLLEMLYLKELICPNQPAQFVSERCLHTPMDSVFKQNTLTDWHSGVMQLPLDVDGLSAVTPYTHLSLRRKGNSENCGQRANSSLSPLRRRVDSADDVSGRPSDGARASGRSLHDITDGVPNYLRYLRRAGPKNGDAVNLINHRHRLDAANLRSDGSQTYDSSSESATQTDMCGDKSGGMSAVSSNSFREEDLRSLLEFRSPARITASASSAMGNDPLGFTSPSLSTSTASSATTMMESAVEEMPRCTLANIPELDSASATADSQSIAEANGSMIPTMTLTVNTVDVSSPARCYRYVPTAELARHPSQRVEPTAVAAPKKNAVSGRRRLYSMEAILEHYAQSIAITNFNANYDLPKYCGGWWFSREKIERYHQAALRRRLSSLASGSTREDALLFFSRFVQMNLRGRSDRLYSSTICINRQSSSAFSSDLIVGMTHPNILDRMAIRMSAMRLFAPEHRKRCHSFPRRASNGGPALSTEDGKLPLNAYATNSQTADNSSTSVKPKNFSKSSVKPPSILVYAADRKELYAEIADALREILPRDTYAVRDLTTRALKFHPWSHEQCACLVVAGTERLDDAAWSQLQEYFNKSGKMLFVCQNALLSDLTSCGSVKKQIELLKNVFERKAGSVVFGKEFEGFLKKSLHQLAKTNEINEVFHAKDSVGGCQFAVVLSKKAGQPFLLYMETSENHRIRSCALFSDATTDELLRNGELIADALSRLGVDVRSTAASKLTSADVAVVETLRLSTGYLICQKDKLILDIKGMTYGKLFNANLKLVFQRASRHNDDCGELPQASDCCLPVLVCRRSEPPKALSDCFDHVAYFDTLKTKQLGRALLYVPVCTSTIDIAKSLATAFPESDGILISGGYQMRGRGRSGNVWLSPRGCATLQFNFNVPIDSELGQSITFVQHIVAVAIVDAIVTRVGDEKFPIKIKWPNDIYYKRDFKLGGILVTASHHGVHFECSIGAGVNISNAKPTVCVNNFLTAGKSITVAEFLAEVMNKFEYYVHLFTTEGKAVFIRRYVERWMHTGEEVSIVHENGAPRERVTLRSLDSDGFLAVESKRTGRVLAVRDDGNSFDIMHGLIHPKE